MFTSIAHYLASLAKTEASIAAERKLKLASLAKIINESTAKDLVFICTHNSRRSHFAQVWMQIACAYLGKTSLVKTFSGGTEATALNPRTAAALGRVGLKIASDAKENPVYSIRFADQQSPIEAFSKVYSHPINPQNGFIAIMTCDEAAEACPLVKGASKRFNLSYSDPKIADDSNAEESVYDERCKEIAQEMLYLATHLK